jgi:hypothetical protein
MTPCLSTILLSCQLSSPQGELTPPSISIDLEPDMFLVSSTPALRELVRSPPAGARVVLYLDDSSLARRGQLAEKWVGFLPQPVASWTMSGPGVRFEPKTQVLQLGKPDAAFPVDPIDLGGRFKAQVVIDLPSNGPGPGAPGDLIGPTVEIELDPEVRDVITLELNGICPQPSVQTETNHLVHVTRPTELIPEHLGERAVQEAWVILPREYENLRADRRFWPTIFVIPEYQPAGDVAARLAKLTRQRELSLILPEAIWVILDPIGLFGHHYFEDSALNGARRRALVEELIPWLDVRFRTVAQPEARLLLGEGAGGRAALGLLAGEPDTFGRAWAIAPDAVSFEHLGLVNLYRGENAFTDEAGGTWPACRTPLGPERELIHFTVRDEVERARVLGNQGQSGTNWDAWRAAFGMPGPGDAFPPWPFDPETGIIDPLTSVDWSERDLLILARRDPAVAECLRTRSRVLVGERDERYRELGVAALAGVLGIDPDLEESPIHVRTNTTNETISPLGRVNAYEEIIEYLKSRELMD